MSNLYSFQPQQIVPPVSTYTVDAFLSKAYPPRADHVSEAIVPQKAKVLVGAAKGTGKTLFLTQGACEMASGDPMLGLFDVPKPLKVMVFQKEIPSTLYQERLETVRRNFFRLRPENLIIVDRDEIYEKLWLDRPDGVKLFYDIIGYHMPDVVMIDPIYLFHNSDEDKAQSVKTIIYPIDQAIIRFGCSFIISHHFKKPMYDIRTNRPQHQGPDDFRGSGVWYHWCDTALWMNQVGPSKNILDMFCRHGREEPPTVVLQLNRNKAMFEGEIQNSPTTNAEVIAIQILNKKPGAQDTFDNLKYDLMKAARCGPREAMTTISQLRAKNLVYYVGAGSARVVRALTPASRLWTI